MLGGARGTNEDAFAWARLATTSSARRNVYAQLGDGLPVGLLGLPRATIDEAAHGGHDRAARPGPQRRAAACSTSACATPRRSGAAGSSSSRRSAPGSSSLRVAPRSATSRARRSPRCSQPLADADGRRTARQGHVVIVVGRANLAESSAATVAALRRAARRGAGRQGAAGVPPRQRGRRAAGRHAPRRGRLDTRGVLQAAADGTHRVPRAARRRPARRLPRRRPRPPRRSPARGASSPSTRSSPRRRSSPTWCSPPAAYAREVAARTPTSRVGSRALAQKVTPAGTTRADWMIAVELALELGADLGYGTVDDDHRRRSPPRSPATTAITVAALGGRATACSPAAPATVDRDRRHRRCRVGRAQRLRLPPRRQPQAVRPGASARRTSPSLAQLAPGARRAPAPARPRARRRRRRRRR